MHLNMAWSVESFQGAMHDSEIKTSNAGAYIREQQSAYMCMYVYTIMCIQSLNSKTNLTISSVCSLLYYLKWPIGIDHVLLQLLMHRKFYLRMCTHLLLLCDSFCARPFIHTYSVIEEENSLNPVIVERWYF